MRPLYLLLAVASLAATKDERGAIPEADNRRGLAGLQAALGDVESIALMRWECRRSRSRCRRRRARN
jgi:hypothetical protein